MQRWYHTHPKLRKSLIWFHIIFQTLRVPWDKQATGLSCDFFVQYDLTIKNHLKLLTSASRRHCIWNIVCPLNLKSKWWFYVKWQWRWLATDSISDCVHLSRGTGHAGHCIYFASLLSLVHTLLVNLFHSIFKLQASLKSQELFWIVLTQFESTTVLRGEPRIIHARSHGLVIFLMNILITYCFIDLLLSWSIPCSICLLLKVCTNVCSLIKS